MNFRKFSAGNFRTHNPTANAKSCSKRSDLWYRMAFDRRQTLAKCAFSYVRLIFLLLLPCDLNSMTLIYKPNQNILKVACVPKMKFLGHSFTNRTDTQTNATERITTPHARMIKAFFLLWDNHSIRLYG